MQYPELVRRYRNFVLLREKGATLAEIAEMYHVTRQAVSRRLRAGIPKPPYRKMGILGMNNLGHLEGRDRTRMMVRIRDQFTCQECGEYRPLTRKKIKGRQRLHDVHHLSGKCGKNSKGYDSSKDLSKMITLCHKCHFNHPEHSYRIKSKKYVS